MKRFFKSKKSQRIKTLTLGFGALLAIIYGLIVIVGIPAWEVFILLFVSILIVLALAVAGFVFTFSFLWIRRKIRSAKL
jgi:hypothetical protein